MSVQKVLRPLTRIQMRFPDFPQELFSSTIEGMTDTTLLVGNPRDKMENVPVEVGQKLVCSVHNPNALYQFKAQVLDRKERGTLNLLVLTKPDNLTRIQRRQFFRLDIVLPILFRVHSEVPPSYPIPFKASKTRDISGGGVLLSNVDSLKRGTLLDLLIELPREFKSLDNISNANIIVCVGSVVGFKNAENGTAYNVEFKFIEDSDREKIIKFIFEEQTKIVNKLPKGI